jgi:hypothetical protein
MSSIIIPQKRVLTRKPIKASAITRLWQSRRPAIVVLPGQYESLSIDHREIKPQNGAIFNRGGKFVFPGTNSYIDLGSGNLDVTHGAHTIVTVAKATSANAFMMLCGYQTKTSVMSVFFSTDSTYRDISIASATGSVSGARFTLDGGVVGPRHHLVIRRSSSADASSSYDAWGNGVRLAKSSSNNHVARSGNNTLGQLSPSALTFDFVGEVELFAIFDSVLSDSECCDLSENPWQILKRRSRHVFVVAGSSNTYTLSPGGSFTFSGSSSVIKTKQYSPSGSVTFSGTATELKTKIQVPSGNITYSGTASITLTNGSTTYTITPSGTITFSGTTDYVKERVVYPTGSITYNGSALELKTRSFVPTGNITFSGNNTEYRTKILAPTGLITFQGSAPITGPGGLTGATMTKLPMTGAGK